MKKISLIFVPLFTVLISFSQNAPIDFEPLGNGADWTWTTFENSSNPDLEIIANPDDSGINTSSTVAKFTALDAGQPYAGCESMHGSDIGSFSLNAETSSVTIMVWKSVISNVGIKLVESSSASLGEILVPNTLTDQWEELTFDFSSMEGIVYDQIVIFPDFQDRDSDNIVYFDNITFGEGEVLETPMTAAPDPTIAEEFVISLFSNVYTDVPVTTWLTDWSNATLSDIQIEGNDTKRYSSVDFLGIEATGDNVIDASEMTEIHIDIWTPNMDIFRIKLVDFGADGLFEGGDDSEYEIIFDDLVLNQWNSLTISLDDFENLTSREHIAQVVLSGTPIGAGILYMDNLYFSTEEEVKISENLISDFEIYPNPASQVFQIKSDEEIQSFDIYNSLGQVVWASTNLKGHQDINISSLPAGSYIVKIQTGKGIHLERLLVQ